MDLLSSNICNFLLDHLLNKWMGTIGYSILKVITTVIEFAL